MKNVLVTGGGGQLALCIMDAGRKHSDLNFIFADSDNLDITNQDEVSDFFRKHTFDYCINCAAFTAVAPSRYDALFLNPCYGRYPWPWKTRGK